VHIIIFVFCLQTNEEQLKEHFSKFGEINDIKLLRKPNGKLIGCGFVQFIVKQNAAKAIAHTSGKDFFGKFYVCNIKLYFVLIPHYFMTYILLLSFVTLLHF